MLYLKCSNLCVTDLQTVSGVMLLVLWVRPLPLLLLPPLVLLHTAGAAQYTTSMITSIMGELTSCAFGNPHSRNPSSTRSTQEVDLARSLVLQHFNADPEQYYVIFTK
eukprot:GHRQ01016737.1.p1 GENE.GHRQ01016737.1~~GHRQ01016737.1.p1  ORF type:complete len:108 (+),score=33.49 GHRQ01016737.1:1367-1690(+)